MDISDTNMIGVGSQGGSIALSSGSADPDKILHFLRKLLLISMIDPHYANRADPDPGVLVWIRPWQLGQLQESAT